ncbi:MAG: hypothetical protein AAGE59_26165 [Cyanobacteria bacterium P01_F01_bin.86]
MKSLILLTGFLAGAIALPGWAHQIKVQEDVGATLHIEPDDIPKAGAPTDLWFALTQAGGTVIPLAACDCSLTIYDSSNQAIATPALVPVSAEGYADIPGSNVTFPDVGAYELLLMGSPTDGTQFRAFELRFEVTVAARAAGSSTSDELPLPSEEVAASEPATTPSSTTPETPTATSETPPLPQTSWGLRGVALAVGGVVAVSVIGSVAIRQRSTGGKS